MPELRFLARTSSGRGSIDKPSGNLMRFSCLRALQEMLAFCY